MMRGLRPMELLRQTIIVSACLNIVAVAALPAKAQTQQEIDSCGNTSNAFSLDLQINGCTAIIKSKRQSRKDLAGAFNNRCLAYSDKKEFDRAIADCNEAIRLTPNEPSLFFNRGNVYNDKGQPDRAIQDYDRAIRLNSNDALAFFHRGSSWEKKNNLQNALADYKKYSELNPSDPGGPKAVERVTKALAPQSDDNPASVNTLLPACKKIVAYHRPTGTLEAMQLGQCMGMVQTLITVGAVMKSDFGFCLPEGFTTKQATSVIIQYVEAHPEVLHKHFVIIGSLALKTAFPCEK